MNTAYLIQQIEQLLREQDSIYHNTAVRFGLSDTAMRVLYLVSETDEVLTQQDLCRQNFSAKQTIHTAINGLVKNGFVELIPIPGTRNHKKILLTASGQALADQDGQPPEGGGTAGLQQDVRRRSANLSRIDKPPDQPPPGRNGQADSKKK